MKTVAMGDLHYGKHRVKPQKISSAIYKYVIPELNDADLLVLAGDWHDFVLHVDNIAARESIDMFQVISKICAKNQTLIRGVRGTYSHDRDQFKVLERIALNHGADIKIYDTIDIEFIESLNLKVLYIPDDLPYDTSKEALSVIHQKLSDAGWTSVDIVIGHGYFEHTLGNNKNDTERAFTIAQFDSIVEQMIIMGHVHTPSSKDFVHYTGSLERLCHGEEHRKGCIVFDMEKYNRARRSYHARRVVNKDASIFATYVAPSTEDANEQIHLFHKWLKKVIPDNPDHQPNIRIVHSDVVMRNVLGASIPKSVDVRVTYKSSGDVEEEYRPLDTQLVYSSEQIPTPNRENLAEITKLYLGDKYEITAEAINTVLDAQY